MFADERLPGRGAGADIERNLCLSKLGGFLIKRMIRLVTPIQSDDIFRKLANQFRIFQNDVAPEHHRFAARGNFALNLFKKLQINFSFAEPVAKLFALAATQIPSFVAADVKELAGKVGEQFIIESAQKGNRAGMIRREGGRMADEFLAVIFVRL